MPCLRNPCGRRDCVAVHKGRASVRASPDSRSLSEQFGLARTLALPEPGRAVQRYSSQSGSLAKVRRRQVFDSDAYTALQQASKAFLKPLHDADTAIARRLQSAFKALARRLSLYCASIARLLYSSCTALARLFTSSTPTAPTPSWSRQIAVAGREFPERTARALCP